MRVLPWMAGIGLALLLAPGARAQQAPTDPIASGELQKTIAVQELTDEYKAYEVRTSGAVTSIYETFLPMMGMMGGMSGNQERSFQLFQASDAFWFKGETVKVGPFEFLKGYMLDLDLGTLASQPASGGAALDLKLKPVLIRSDSVLVVSAKPLMTKERLVALIEGKPMAESPTVVASKKAQTTNKMKQVALAMMMYASDYDDQFPYVQGTASARAIVYPYVKNVDVFKSDNPLGDGQILMNMALAGVFQPAIASPDQTVLLYESAPWPYGGRIFAFADGHVKSVGPEEAETIMASMRAQKFPRKGKPLPMGHMAHQDPLAAWLRERAAGISEGMAVPAPPGAPPDAPTVAPTEIKP